MKQVLVLTQKQFSQVTEKINDCQANRDQREIDLTEQFGPEKETEDRYDTDKMLRLWLDIEGVLENFLDESGYEFNHQTCKFMYQQKKGPNW